ncbi:MAG: ribosomal protein S18-alanine N-acetyltransferase [Chloroflexota bacterium]
MKIRPMIEDDLKAVCQIDQISFSQPWPDAAFEIELHNINARNWVVELEQPAENQTKSTIVAAMVIWRVLDEAHIATIAVHPEFRQRGIGKKLLQYGMDAAFEDGARIYHLEVRGGNLAAQKMYLDLGFEIVGIRPKYYQDNGEDALLMTLDLTQPLNFVKYRHHTG